jgi:hypothetical protein
MLRVVYLIDHKQAMEVRFHAAKKIGLISINIGVPGGWPKYAELPVSVGVSEFDDTKRVLTYFQKFTYFNHGPCQML